jgi:hypothetical protein
MRVVSHVNVLMAVNDDSMGVFFEPSNGHGHVSFQSSCPRPVARHAKAFLCA